MRYLSILKACFLEECSYRLGWCVILVGNIIHLIITYYFWKAVYAASVTPVVNGMNFEDTIVYVSLSGAMFSFMECYLVWKMGRDYHSGQIIVDLLRPLDYQLNMFCYSLGGMLFMFIMTFIPAFIITLWISNLKLKIGLNIIYFFLLMMLSICINFLINFCVGVICFYTESIWGINIVKDVVISIFSGVTVPLAFFPDGLRIVIDFLPFQAIYNLQI